MTDWTLYILRCADDSLYTGITNDLDRRLAAHTSGEGAKYTRGRGPFQLIYSEQHDSRSSATKREVQVKKLSRSKKLQLSSEQ